MRDNSEKSEEGAEITPRKTLVQAFRDNIVNMAWIAAISIAATVVGYHHSGVVPDWMLKAAMESMEQMEKSLQENPILSSGKYFVQLSIFLYMTFILGIAASLPPVYVMFSSALLTGAISATKGAGLGESFPHSIPDALDAAGVWVALSWGAKLGLAWFHRPRQKYVKEAFIEGHAIFFKVVMPLLAAAFLFRVAFRT